MFTACVYCDDFHLLKVNLPAWTSNQALQNWKREMQMSPLVTEMVFLPELTKQRATDLASGWELAKE